MGHPETQGADLLRPASILAVRIVTMIHLDYISQKNFYGWTGTAGVRGGLDCVEKEKKGQI